MPLLPAEPFLNPANLFAEPPATEDAVWWVLHTRPRAEKSLGRAALRDGLSYFLPLHRHRWYNKGRLFTAHLPLFPGYVFVHGDEGMVARLLETRQVANCIPVSDQRQLWDDLTRVYRLIDSGLDLAAQERLVPGARVVITAGTLAGFEGTLIRSGGRNRLVVEVHLIRRGVAVEVEEWMVKPVARDTCRCPA